MGGGDSLNGDGTENGLIVSDGASLGAAACDWNANDLRANVVTGGGDETLLADDATGHAGKAIPVAISNTSAVTISSAVDVAGPVAVRGGEATLNAPVAATAPDVDIRIGANRRVTLGVDQSTEGGDVAIIADHDGVEADLRIDGDITTSGGGIRIGGDFGDNGAGATWDPGSGDGVAHSGAGVTVTAASVTQAAGVDVSTGGADVRHTGANGAATAAMDPLIHLTGTASGAGAAAIDASGGAIDLSARFVAGGVVGGDDRPRLFTDAVLRTSGDGAIIIAGDATNTPTPNAGYGVAFLRAGAIRAAGGSILIDGTGGFASTNARGVVVDRQALSVLSEKGAITFRDATPADLKGTCTGLSLQPGSHGDIVLGPDGAAVVRSPSDIAIEADRVTFDARASAFDTRGAVVLAPLGASFAAGVDTTNIDIAARTSGVRVGKAGGGATIVLGRALSSLGTVALRGGDVAGGQYCDGAKVIRLDDDSIPGASVAIGAADVVSNSDGAGGVAMLGVAPAAARLSGAGRRDHRRPEPC